MRPWTQRNSWLIHTYLSQSTSNFGLRSNIWRYLHFYYQSGKMGPTPILPVKEPVTIDTMLKHYRAEYQAEFKINQCRYVWTRLHLDFLRRTKNNQNESRLLHHRMLLAKVVVWVVFGRSGKVLCWSGSRVFHDRIVWHISVRLSDRSEVTQGTK